ncbi:MAG: trypsin-like peptidase domain-containing protein [Planctomycetales bacterium]
MRTWIIGLWLCLEMSSLAGQAAHAASEARESPQVRAIRRAKAAVVNIHSERTSRDRDRDRDRDGLSEGGGRKINGMGTGIVIDERGYIVTNQHVIADVDSLRVTLYDGSTFNAIVTSYDIKHDLAIIKINPSRPLPVIPLGTSSDVMLGETVLAVGNPFGYEHSVSQGIISSLSRDVEVNDHQSYKNLLQTDASINPGNSGGPLLNLDGEVIGINVAIRAGAQRIGFAIPIDDARRFIANLLDIRKLDETFHGLIAHDVKSPESKRLVVDAAEPNSPAAVAGFLPGDVVTRVGNLSVNDKADLERAFHGQAAGAPVDVVIDRNGSPATLTVQLARVDPTQIAGPPAKPLAGRQVKSIPGRPRLVADDALASKSWNLLGVKLDKASPAQLESFRSRYRGGMKVLDVRPSSPASRHGIRRGDILVGLDKWETVKHEDIQYILNQTRTTDGDAPLKFYVVRGQEVLFGNLNLPEQRK